MANPPLDRAPTGRSTRPVSDARRRLQLVLAGIWLLDGLLQYQSWMFTRAFAQGVIAPTAQGNPHAVAAPIHWTVSLVEHHPLAWNLVFATIQLLLGLGIAWRRTLRVALAASVVWALLVWWLGEGLGGLFAGGAVPVTGAPGAVILYAVAAVLLWPVASPAGGEDAAPAFVASRPLGTVAARLIWVVLWGGLAVLSLQPALRGADALHDAITGMGDGQPGWVASSVNGLAHVVAGHGTAYDVVLALAFALVALSQLVPSERAGRAGVVLALAVAAVVWLCGEALGDLVGGQATDVNSGPLLALIALAYWPRAHRSHGAARAPGTTEAALA